MAQVITCQDCKDTFDFTEEDAKRFEEKGYENLPLRCLACRKKRTASFNRRRRNIRSKGNRNFGRNTRKPNRDYVKPLPPPQLTFDGKTLRGGQVVFVGRRFGFLEFKNGNIYFELSEYSGDDMATDLMVDFVVDKDDKNRPFAKSLVKSRAAPRRRNNAKDTPAPKPKVERVMINITVQCEGKDSVVVEKPIERATFQIFRRQVLYAYKFKIQKNFKLAHNGEILTYEAFNKLVDGDAVDVIEDADK